MAAALSSLSHVRPAKPFTSPQRRSSRALVTYATAANKDSAETRRSVLAGLAGAALAAPLLQATPAAAEVQVETKVIPKENLSIVQKNGIRKEIQERAEAELKKVLTAADAPAAMRLLLHDAGTYDPETKTGGVDGSIVLPEELNRAENKDLKPLVEKLSKAKEAIDARGAKVGQAPFSWADTIVLGAKVATQLSWRQGKVARAKTPEGGATIASQFGTLFTVRLGREDATQPAPAGKLPGAGASAKDVQAFMLGLSGKASSGPFSPKPTFYERPTFVLWPATQDDPVAAEAALAAEPAFAEYKVKYDRSRSTLSRTDYEADFVEYFNRLADLGAKFDKDKYDYPITFEVPARF